MGYFILTFVFLVVLALVVYSLKAELAQEREISDSLEREIAELKKLLDESPH